MKTIFLLFIILFALINPAFSQDLILIKSGEYFNCKIITEKQDQIEYNHQGDTVNVSLSLVAYYEKGYFEKDGNNIDSLRAQHSGNIEAKDTTNVAEINTSNEVVFNQNVAPKIKLSRLRIAINGGASYMLGENGGRNSIERDHINKLRLGLCISPSISYFFWDNLGLGLKYSYWNATNTTEDLYIRFSDGTMARGDWVSTVTLQQFEPALYMRLPSDKNFNAWVFFFSMGYLDYNYEETLASFKGSVEGETFTMGYGAGYDINFSDNLALNLELSFNMGSLTSLKYREGGQTRTINLEPDEAHSVSHINLTAGLIIK